MNLFQAIYCNQYEELVRTGRDGSKAHKNGIVIITVAIVLNLFSIVLLLVIFGHAGFLASPMREVAGMTGSGRRAGRLIALVLLIIIGFAVWLTIGRKDYYDRTIQSFIRLPHPKQKQAAKKGAAYLLGSVGVFILLLILSFVMTR